MRTADPSRIRILYLVLPLVLVAVLLVAVDTVAWASGGPGIPHQITTSTGGVNRVSQEPQVSGSGEWIVFRSDADFLGQGIPDNQQEIWLVNTGTLSYTQVTTASAPDRSSYDTDISANGRIVAFRSDSDLFNQGIEYRQYELWLYDIPTMTYRRVTTSSGSGRSSHEPSLSGTGRYVAFQSDADLLHQGVRDNQREIWIYDAVTMNYTRVTSNTPESRRASISADGRYVAFESSADHLGRGAPEVQAEVWLYDTVALTYTRVTTASGADRDSRRPSVNRDGSLVAFESDSDFFNESIPDDQTEIWLYNTITKVYTRVTTAAGTGGRESGNATISDDGKLLVFESNADLCGTGKADDHDEIWAYRIPTGILARVTNTYSETYNSWPDVGAYGDYIAFGSSALFWEDGQQGSEIWMNFSDRTAHMPVVLEKP